MDSVEAARSCRPWQAMVAVGALVALVLLVGPTAEPASACDCSLSPDATAFEQSDAVFVGRLVDYEPPPTRTVMSSADPATWTFEVSDVYKGEVAATQEIVSEVSGASCGLEIPREGEFLVFATEQGFQMAVGDGQYYAGLCGGTRSTSDGPLAVDAPPSPPESAQETTSVTIDQKDDHGMRLATVAVAVGVASALAIVGVAVLAWRRVGGARS